MIRFTIGLSEQLNCLQRKAWDSNPHGACAPHGLANRPGEPYPATFRSFCKWTRWELNPSHRSCKDQSPPRNMRARFQNRDFKLGISESHRLSPAYEAGEETVSPIPEYPRVESNHCLNRVEVAPCRWTTRIKSRFTTETQRTQRIQKEGTTNRH